MADESLAALLELALDAAWQAGKLTSRYFQTGIIPELKADESPVTIADRESERLLRHLILSQHPHHGILGEEDGESNPGASHRWILDPIDGTRAFVRGVPIYGVMVALERDGVPILGVVNMPALGEVVAAARGLGCTWNGRRCRVSSVATLREGLMVTTTTLGYAQAGKHDAFERLAAASGQLRTWGDCYGYLLVATGRAELMVDPVMNVWDCAALLPILEEAGGTFTTWTGEPTIWGGEAVATNGLIYEEVMRLIAG